MSAATLSNGTGAGRIGRGCAACAVSLALVACESPPPANSGSAARSAPTPVAVAPRPAPPPPPAPAPLLEHCTRPIGSLSVQEDDKSALTAALRNARLGSTQAPLHMLALLSNCFAIVETPAGSKARSTADFILAPSIKSPDAVKRDSVAAVLTLTDNRSAMLVAQAEGSSTRIDDDGLASLMGGSVGASLGGYMTTPAGRMWAAAFANSFNQIVHSAVVYVPRPGTVKASPVADAPPTKPTPARTGKKAARPAATAK